MTVLMKTGAVAVSMVLNWQLLKVSLVEQEVCTADDGDGDVVRVDEEVPLSLVVGVFVGGGVSAKVDWG